MLMRDERLARLTCAFDPLTHVLSIARAGKEVVRGDLRSSSGRVLIERFFSAYCAAERRGEPKVLCAPGHSFSDVSRKVVSIINLACVQAIETWWTPGWIRWAFAPTFMSAAGRRGMSSRSWSAA